MMRHLDKNFIYYILHMYSRICFLHVTSLSSVGLNVTEEKVSSARLETTEGVSGKGTIKMKERNIEKP